jgi:Sec-independent protein translocase protein TatA
MTIGITQVILILIVAVLLFGNFRGILKDFAEGVMVFRETLNKESSSLSSKPPLIGEDDEDKDKTSKG